MKEEKVFHTITAKQTQRVGFLLAEELAKQNKASGAVVIALQGNLGSGKTTFIQGFGQGMGVEENILSPTFVILKQYRTEKKESNMQNLYHIDCYRIEGPKDIHVLGWDDIIKEPQNVVLVEWAERIKEILPQDIVWITFEAKETYPTDNEWGLYGFTFIDLAEAELEFDILADVPTVASHLSL